MFTLEDDVIEQIREVEIKLGDQALTLVMRPVTDDERVKDSALHQKFVFEDDPEKAVEFFKARDNLKKSVVIAWKGIEAPSGKPIPFSKENFTRLLKSKAVRSLVIDAVNDHFNGRVQEAALGELPESSRGSLQGDSKDTSDSRQSSVGTVTGSQQDNLQQG